ncbi:MAG: aromatic ring-hydroxylating dioxygenase subunit alpha [Myxococcota bacterium]|nr:aromatic ring-hydroxylating dioxygenase subunit alpha [Myxococcales bacterium]
MSKPHLSGLTEAEAAGIQIFEKPAPGSWTEALGLDTGAMSFEDSFDPEFYEDEKEAVFRRNWLNLGRIEQLPRRGTFFTKELEFLGVSILVVRDLEDRIRAFHNVCSHRGNKLMWDRDPSKESRGNCRQIACKYHGWRYRLDGEIDYVHNAPEFFDLDPARLKLPPIHLELWAGFIWINLEQEPRQSLREFLTPTVAKLETYPFEKMTRVYTFQSEINANWKLFMDAFQELYHVPYVHGKVTNAALEQTGVDKVPQMIPFFGTYGKHRLMTSGGANANQAVRARRPIDALFQANFIGTDYTPDVGPLGDGVNPAGIENWGVDSWQFYPNFVIITWKSNYWYTYHYWPTGPTSHRFEWTVAFAEPTNTRERLAQEHALVMMREGILQDANTLEATQMGIMSRARNDYYLCDQEVALRHLHTVIQDDVAAYRAEKGR